MTAVETTAHRVLTVPNVITVVRLGCLPVFPWLLFHDEQVAAALMLGALGATDWVDGYVARHFDQVSDLGKVLDPVADRLLFLVCVTSMIVDDAVPRWFAITVLTRELVVGGSVLVLTSLGMKRVDVTWWGKAGTFGLMVAFPAFLLGSSTVRLHRMWQAVGWLVGLPALGASLYAAARYVPLFRKALAEGRKARQR
jgi:cardiolipin synthase